LLAWFVRSSQATTSALSKDLPSSINVRGVMDPRTGLELSVSEAVDAGIFDPATGEFIGNPNTGDQR